MKSRMLFLCFSLFTLGFPTSHAQSVSPVPQPATRIPDPASIPVPPETRAQRDARMSWWREARFGMFIHWGLYSVPAGEWNGKTGYGEWIRTSAEIPLEMYDRFRPRFNPVKFDADAWVKMASDAGMKYIVITSKHHDGFCMFDTKQTDFNIMTTPFSRDPMTELAADCKKYGLKFCFYHSIMDWHHPDYLPRRDWEKYRTVQGADFDRYVAYMKAELKELLTNYGDIGVLWFDGEWERTWNEKYGREIYNYVRGLQPDILVNNRVGAGRLDMEGLTREGAFGGDFGTPEQQIPATWLAGVDWETCMTMNDHWGYNKADRNFKSAKELIRMLVDIASKGGNYLLNIGPTAEGLFPQESIDRLAAIGQWMKVNGESIYGTGASPFRHLPWGRCTRKTTPAGTILYLHVFDWPDNGKLLLSGVLNTPGKAFLLADPKRKPLNVVRREDALMISLPKAAPDTVNSVIALELQGKLNLTDPPLITSGFDTFVDSLPVLISTDRENVEIRYNIGKSEPTANSSLYQSIFTINGTTTISARCFRQGKPVSGTVTRVFRKVEPVRAMEPVSEMKPGLHFRYYEGAWDSLPDFGKLTPVKEGTVPGFVFTPRNQDDLFSFVYTGFVLIQGTDVYRFYTGSDDGSRLYIDDKLVVRNDGLHGMEENSGTIALAKGYHWIRVAYFDRTGNDSLEVSVQSQVLPKQVLPESWLFN